MITGVVLARNEEHNIVDCLLALRTYVGELIVIDMESTDRTVELASQHADRILRHPLIPNFDSARNIAIPQASNDWLWFIDADERVSEATGKLVNDLVRERGHEISAISIPFKSYFCGKWIEHCGWWPGYTMPRVLKRGYCRFREKLHSGVDVDGVTLQVPPDPNLAIEHFSYPSLERYVEKFNRYTSAESANLAESGITLSWQTAMRAMVRDLWQYYEANEGRLDGRHGWILSWLAGQYRWFSHSKLIDLEGGGQDTSDAPANLDEVISLMQREITQLRASSPELPLGITWRSQILDPSGYADDARGIVKSLAAGSRELALEPMDGPQQQRVLADADLTLFKALCRAKRPAFSATITSCIPTHCAPDPQSALNILRTTFETDRLPVERLGPISQFDEVWVFSQHDKLAFRQGGVPPEKIRVLGSFVDTSVFTLRGKRHSLPEQLEDRFVFLSIFDWQLRKGWDILLRAYCQEFSDKDNVGLLMKISRAHGHPIEVIHRQIEEVLGQFGQIHSDRPDIVVLDELLEPPQLAALYRSVGAFAMPSRGEGWGRPYMEAMATGLPVIGTAGSGNADFMNEENSYLIPAELVDVSEAAACEIPVFRGHRWLEPDESRLREAMREVVDDDSKRKRIGRKAASHIRSNYDISHARERVEELLQAAEGRFQVPDVVQAATGIRVELEGELFASHSFSNINEQLALQFMQNDKLTLSINRKRHNPTNDDQAVCSRRIKAYVDRPLPDGPEVIIRHAFPPNWESPTTGTWVHIQPWEFGALPLDWVEPLRDRVDEVWAPSNYVKRVYEQSGVSGDKVHVIPWGVDPDVYTPDAPPLHISTYDKSFVFLFVGGTIARKGFDILFQAYMNEFSHDDDVCLVIKDVGTSSFYRYGNFRPQVLEAIERGDGPCITYIESDMTPGQLASLYTASDCLVAPYRGEGFGLPILEAMACGVTPLVPKGGASDDFVSEETAILVPATEVECDHGSRLCGTGTELSIDVADVQRAMRTAFESAEATRAIGLKASEHVRERFTWAKTAELMAQRIKVLRNDSVPVREQPRETRLPTMTACLLLQNDELTLGDCLGRIRPFAREIIVLDVGSSDRSVPIALEYGARGYKFDFRGSYSEARNFAIRRATSDWILMLEPWEVVREKESFKIQEVLQSVDKDVWAVSTDVQKGDETDSQVRERCIRGVWWPLVV